MNKRIFFLPIRSGMYFAGFICYNKFPYMSAMMLDPIPIILSIINIATVFQIFIMSMSPALYESIKT
jgi:hypothetical protein